MKIVRPKSTSDTNLNRQVSPVNQSFTPLPRTIRNPDDHKGKGKILSKILP